MLHREEVRQHSADDGAHAGSQARPEAGDAEVWGGLSFRSRLEGQDLDGEEDTGCGDAGEHVENRQDRYGQQVPVGVGRENLPDDH